MKEAKNLYIANFDYTVKLKSNNNPHLISLELQNGYKYQQYDMQIYDQKIF